MPKLLVLIDGNNFAYANYHVHKDLCTSAGVPTGLLHGCLMGLVKLKRLFPGAIFWVVWDGPGKGWRRQCSARYKANRDYTSGNTDRSAIFSQADELRSILDLLLIPQITLNGVEADDAIGVLTTIFEEDFERIVIRSNDKDFYQLVSDKVSCFASSGKDKVDSKTVWGKLMTPKLLLKRFSLTPDRWTEFRALMGDDSDNLDGLAKGVGAVTAGQMLAAGLHLPVDHPPFLGVKRLDRLTVTKSDWERVNENLVLSTIIRDPEDPLLPTGSKKFLKEFVYCQRTNGFARDWTSIDTWCLCKHLGRFELAEAISCHQYLLKIF